jgi:uncharacterized RDD family membrane protein YckC
MIEAVFMRTCRIRRLFAAFIDNAAGCVLMVTVGSITLAVAVERGLLNNYTLYALRQLNDQHALLTQDVLREVAIPLAIFMVPGMLYRFSEVITSATLGKLLLGIRIAIVNGKPASIEQRFMRWLIKNSVEIIFLIGVMLHSPQMVTAAGIVGLPIGVGTLLILFPFSQTIWDRFADTCVYLKRDMVEVSTDSSYGNHRFDPGSFPRSYPSDTSRY